MRSNHGVNERLLPDRLAIPTTGLHRGQLDLYPANMVRGTDWAAGTTRVGDIAAARGLVEATQ